MSKNLAIVFILAGFGLIATFQNCGGQNLGSQNLANSQITTAQAVNLTGTVQTLNLEGCGKVIVSDADGTSKFIPHGTDTSVLAEGSKVQLIGTVASDLVSSCMAGVIVNVSSLKTVPAVAPVSGN